MNLFFLVITHHFPQTFHVIHLTIPLSLVLATGLLATVKQRVDPLQYTSASSVDSLSLKDIQPEHAYLMEAGLEVFPSAIAIATMTLSLKMLLIMTTLVSQMLPAQ